MKLKKILFLIVIFFAVLVPISNADTDEVKASKNLFDTCGVKYRKLNFEERDINIKI